MHAGRALLEQARTADAKEQLERALAFYRSVEATRYIAEIEQRLAELQRDSA
jgi:hypothetical protein